MKLEIVTLKVHVSRLMLSFILCATFINSAMADGMKDKLVIDDRSNIDVTSNLGTKWQLVTDNVMGGLSQGQLTLDSYKGRQCLRMRGDVTTENNGGFVQIALSLSELGVFDASGYTGVEIEVAGNNELYNIHFRTGELWFPWQSYRYSFTAASDWQTYRIPFSGLEKYKTLHSFSQDEIKRIGLVAIGRDFQADLCLAAIAFYHD
ncbi:MAG: CIA30 family protein [Gammaproteobacteria bacterium]|jgi:hypothetical protein|nr:CIA30 family protein [Gammaproteobacteria bacterium]